jgi:hypothetical protein
MDVIEAYAKLSVARGCGFALLAIACVMIGLMGTPVFALKIAGVFCAVIAAILMVRADLAPRMNFKDTEVWLMLEVAERPPPAVAQRIISGVLSRTFAEFGLYFARGAIWVLCVAFFLELILR